MNSKSDARLVGHAFLSALPIAIMAVLCAVALVGCGPKQIERPEPVIETVEVKVPVDDPACARKAVAEIPAIVYPDTDEALSQAPNVFERVKLLVAGRVLRQAREAMLIGSLVECAR